MKLLPLLEYGNTSFFAWTVIYLFVLSCRLPAEYTTSLWLPSAALLAIGFLMVRRTRPVGWGREARFGCLVLGLGCLWAVPTLFLEIPNIDDLFLFHRVLWQVGHPDQPFPLWDTTHGRPDLPAISYLHVATSYEPFVGLVSSALGLDPLFVYQQGGTVLASVLFVVVYALLYRRFRFGPTTALLATAVALGFLVLDGGPNEVRSYGNLAFRFWKAKFMLWLVGLPYVLLLGLRFLARPTRWRWAQLFMANVCGFGLSNSGIFLIPALVFALSVATLLTRGRSRKWLRRAVVLNLSSVFCVGAAVALVSGVIPEPADRSVWSDPALWPQKWRGALALVVPDAAARIRTLFLVLVLPGLALGRSLRALPVVYGVVLALLFFNPVTGPFWLRLLQPGSYWRLVYLLPVPWYAGLVVGCFRPSPVWRTRAVRFGTAAAVPCLLVLAGRSVSFDHSISRSRVQAPRDYKFDAPERAFVPAARQYLTGRVLLAPPELAVVCGLTNPEVRLYATHWSHTPHIFANAGHAPEGHEHVSAQEFVSGNRSAEQPFRRALAQGVSAVATSNDHAAHVFAILQQGPGHWSEVARTEHYTLFIRE